MERIRQLNKFKDSFFVKYFIFIIMGLLGLAACIFLFLYTNYKEDFVIDLDGYMISTSTLEDIKSDDVSLEKISTVKVKSQDTIYKNKFNKYINGNKRKSVNINYPLYVNDGLTIVNYNESVNLLNTDLERSTGYRNLVLSYGKIYDGNDYTQIDKESYLLLSYEDDLFINLYDLKIETTLNTYEIPTNSIIYFMDDRINYFERKNNIFIRKTLDD